MSDRRIVRTMCPMNCHPTLCGMEAEVESGRLLALRGDPSHPDSRGFLCMRGNAAHEIVGNPARILRPRIRDRRGGKLREAGWDEALDLIAARMRRAGPEATGMWQGHGVAANDYGVGVKRGQMERFANLWGCNLWTGQMICWGLGGFGIGLTGALETSLAEDMGENAALIVLWGANSPSQANTIPHVDAAKRRGARVVAVDVRRTEASALAHETLLVRPGSDAALALALMHVIVAEGLHDRDFIAAHAVGFEDLAAELPRFTPEWAAAETGLAAERIVAFARDYAGARPATIVLGGSSLHKGRNGWRAARAISCLPALVGDYGRPGGGLGPRHGARAHGAGFADLSAADRRKPGPFVPNQMEAAVEALETGRVTTLLTFGANFLSSFADSNRTRAALAKAEFVTAMDIFDNSMTREAADVVLPGTIWLEETGVKATAGWVHLCDRALAPAGEARPVWSVYRDLAARLGVEDVYPWPDQEAAIDAVLAHPATGFATVAAMRAGGGRAALKVSPVSHPTRVFATPSGKVEFRSDRAAAMGLPALPEPPEPEAEAGLALATGRSYAAFHGFYDHGRALPTLAAREPEPELWLSPVDAAARGIDDGAPVRIANARGEMAARAKVTKRMPEGAVWMRDGWPDLNALTDGAAVLPEAALGAFPFSVGQARFGGRVEVEALR